MADTTTNAGAATTLETMVRLPTEPGYYIICAAGSTFSRDYDHVLRVRKWDENLQTRYRNGTWNKDREWGKNAHAVFGPCSTDDDAYKELLRLSEVIAAALSDAVVDVDGLELDFVPIKRWAAKNTSRYYDQP